MKQFTIILPIATAFLLMACRPQHQSSSSATDSAVVISVQDADTSALLVNVCNQQAIDSPVIVMLTDMYNNELYQDYEWLEQHCTDKCLQYLREEYETEYICESEDCYAVWKFRTNNQDGYTNEHRMVSVDNKGNGYYEYTFIDMGFQGTNRVRITQQNDSLYIDEIQQIAEEGF